MRAPKPERIIEDLDELARLLPPAKKGEQHRLVGLRADLEEAYRWLYGPAHAPMQRHQERVRSGGPNTGGTTANVGLSGAGDRALSSSTQDYVRSKLSSAGQLIEDATAAARGAATELSRAFARIDKDIGHTPTEYHDNTPRQEEPDEIDRLRGAQRRRDARGEVYAEDAVPRPDIEYERHEFLGKALLCRRCGETRVHPVHDVEEEGDAQAAG